MLIKYRNIFLLKYCGWLIIKLNINLWEYSVKGCLPANTDTTNFELTKDKLRKYDLKSTSKIFLVKNDKQVKLYDNYSSLRHELTFDFFFLKWTWSDSNSQ